MSQQLSFGAFPGRAVVTALSVVPAVGAEETAEGINYSATPTSYGTTTTASPAVVASRLAQNAAQGISSVASGLAPSVSSAVLTSAQQAALKANPNLTAAQLQSLAPASGVSQWLSTKSSLFPSETNGSVLLVGGIVAAGVLVLSQLSGKKRR